MITVTTSTDSQKEAQEAAGATPSQDAPAKPASPKGETETAGDSETPETSAQETDDKGDKNSAGARIKHLTWKAGEEERKRQAAEQKAQQLERELAEARKAPKAEAKPAADPNARPDPNTFKTYDEYTEALTEWKMEQREAAKAKAETDRVEGERRKAAEERQQKALESWTERIAEARTRYPDFNQVTGNTSVPVSDAMTVVMMESERGADLAYYLGKNIEEAKRIAALTPYRAARELAKIEESLPPLDAAEAPPAHTPETRHHASSSGGSEPIRPVGTSRGASAKNPDDMSFKEYKRWREAGGGQ